MLKNIKQDLQKLANLQKAQILQRFFKTGKGQYGEGDKFLGITVPNQRKIAKKYLDTSLSDLQKLLNTKIHEYRLVALLILVDQYKNNKKQVFNFYLKNTKNINNWDLVDLTAHKIIGDYLLSKDRKILYKLAKSNSLWERRVSIISTFEFIRQGDFKDSIKISKILLHDKHDLIHKAVGWMLREIGKRDQKVLVEFLDKHASQMPRTMLRYSIEKFDEPLRKHYLKI